MKPQIDVFLSYNSNDKPTVRQLAEALEARGITVWLDEEQLVPGRPWQEALEKVIETVRTVAVLVGDDGLGPWEIPEMRACLSEFVDRHLPVIPVLLPDAPARPQLPLFLRGFTWVDLRGGLTETSLDRLQWGITGIKPEQSRGSAEDRQHTNLLVTKENLDQLLTFLQKCNVSQKAILEIFRKSYGTCLSPIEGESDLSSRQRMLIILADASLHGENTFPILEFLMRVIERSYNGIEFLPLVYEIAKQLELKQNTIGEMRARIGSEKGGQIFRSLMVDLEPKESDVNSDDPNRQQFFVRAWLWHGPDEDVEKLETEPNAGSGDPLPYTIEQMPNVLDHLIFTECLKKRLRTTEHLMIELFLPICLLKYELDYELEYKWKIEVVIEEWEPIGVYLPVFLRARDRIAGPYWHKLWMPWKEKWEQFIARSDGKANKSVLYDTSIKTPWQKNIKDTLKKEESIFLALTRNLSSESKDEWSKAIITVLNTGTPIVLWHGRDDEPSGNIQQRFDKLLSDCSLEDLPQQIFEKRKHPTWQSYHLKLWWDAMNRLPYEPFLE